MAHVYNLWTAEFSTVHAIFIAFFHCDRVETAESGCSIDHTSLSVGQHLYLPSSRADRIPLVTLLPLSRCTTIGLGLGLGLVE